MKLEVWNRAGLPIFVPRWQIRQRDADKSDQSSQAGFHSTPQATLSKLFSGADIFESIIWKYLKVLFQ